MKAKNNHSKGRRQSAAKRHSRGCGFVAALASGLAAFAFATASAETDNVTRDPFWPLGYAPPKPEPEKPPQALEPEPEKPKPPKEPEKPVVLPVTESEWNEARKLLSISGQIRSTRPDTGETRVQMMINRQTYGIGDLVCVTNRGTIFVWQLESPSTQDLQLKQTEATRLQSDTKQNKTQ